MIRAFGNPRNQFEEEMNRINALKEEPMRDLTRLWYIWLVFTKV